jgi:hypothetical protein
VKEEEELDGHFLTLAASEKEQKHVRRHTVQLHKQLAAVRDGKRSQEDSELASRQTSKRGLHDSPAEPSNRIRFRASGGSE